MSASELQQQRTREYFIEAAKTILRGEGLKVASARNIAEKAGYSYATLYNYFDDLSSLIFECVKDFQSEIEELTVVQTSAEKSGMGKLLTGLTAWVNYFVQYPGIFELFFLERIGESGTKNEISDTIYNSIVPACSSGLDMLVDEGKLSEEEAVEKLNILRYQTTGLLLYYSNRKNPRAYTGLLQLLERQVKQVMA